MQASENKEVYSVRECCSDGGNTRAELLASLLYSVPTLPVVPRPQANHPHADVDPNCIPSFQTLRLMESVPYVSATFNGHTGQFLLDTGAGGVEVIFHGRAVEEFELLRSIHSETYTELLGINASGKNLEVTLGILDHLTIAGRSLKQVKVNMLARQNGGNLDTSEYISGLLCGDLLMRCRIVFGYALRRFAVQ